MEELASDSSHVAVMTVPPVNYRLTGFRKRLTLYLLILHTSKALLMSRVAWIMVFRTRSRRGHIFSYSHRHPSSDRRPHPSLCARPPPAPTVACFFDFDPLVVVGHQLEDAFGSAVCIHDGKLARKSTSSL